MLEKIILIKVHYFFVNKGFYFKPFLLILRIKNMRNIKITPQVSFLIVMFFSLMIFTPCLGLETASAVKKKVKAKTEIAQSVTEKNPFFEEYQTPFKVPPFNKIKEAHFMPAFKRGFVEAKKGIDTIVNNTEKPTFQNTIEEMELNGKLLTKVASVFFHLNGADTTEGLLKIADEVTPMFSKYRNYVNLNDKLFKKIDEIYKKRNELNLTADQKKLLEDTYRRFVRNGAALKPEDKKKIEKITEEMAGLSLKFRKNLLNDTNSFKMFLDKKEDIEGLPRSLISAAAAAAKKEGKEGQWLFTLHKPSWIPFLQFSPKRDLREKLYKGYINRCNNNDEFDNKKIIARIVALRAQRAHIMGYKTHADFRLEINMSKNPDNVYKLLNKLWTPALKMAKKEVKDLQAMIDKEGGKFKLESWDWWYYSEKLRKEKYDLDENLLKPYFQVDKVREGAFYVANKLYGIKFIERHDIPVYHKDAKVFEVKETDGSHIGILYTDYFYRTSKRGGAWCGGLRDYSNIRGNKITPVIYNVCNFAPPVGDEPSLLSFDQAATVFHEFGHALHSLFCKSDYPGLANVARDFVELPAQIMEHWCAEPEVMKIYARHYKTSKVIPEELIKKLEQSSHFNQGFATVEYLAASLLDMNFHTLKEAKEVDTARFEADYLKKIGLIPQIISRYRSTYFQHIVGGYDCGYHAYIWAEVLDCDAFEAFKETSLFDQKTAKSFRENILSMGGRQDEMIMYKKFRGREPKIDGLMKKRGFK
jgi:peptidyl-dipeptidase Dcp